MKLLFSLLILTTWQFWPFPAHATPMIDIMIQEEGPDTRTFPSASGVPFVIVVTNTGSIPVFDVKVVVSFPDFSFDVGSLDLGEFFTNSTVALNVTTSFISTATVTSQSSTGAGIFTDSDTSSVVIETIRAPEPATLAIFGLGLAGLGFMRRRRKAA